MKQTYMNKTQKKYTEEKQVTKDRFKEGQYWVRSDKYSQLYYRVVLTDNDCYCACKDFKYNRNLACKHILRVLALDVKVMEA